MKKLISGILALAACAALLAGCGGKEADSGKQPAAADVVKAVAAELTFKDAMITLEDDMVENIYNLDMEKIADKSCYISGSRATAEEVSVFQVKDSADLQMVKDAVAERIGDQKHAYESYNPGEMVKINGAVTLTHGNYVILVMADDTSKVEETFNAQF